MNYIYPVVAMARQRPGKAITGILYVIKVVTGIARHKSMQHENIKS